MGMKQPDKDGVGGPGTINTRNLYLMMILP